MLGTSSARPVYRDRCQTSERGRLSNFYPDRMGQRGQTRLNFTLQIFLPQWVLFRGFNIIIPGIMSGQLRIDKQKKIVSYHVEQGGSCAVSVHPEGDPRVNAYQGQAGFAPGGARPQKVGAWAGHLNPRQTLSPKP